MLTFTVFENHKKSHFSIIVTTLALPISYLRSRGRHPVSSSSVSQVRSAWPGCYIFHMWQLFVLLMCLEAVRERKTVGTGSQACLPQYFSAINWRWKPTVVVSSLRKCPNLVVVKKEEEEETFSPLLFVTSTIDVARLIQSTSILPESQKPSWLVPRPISFSSSRGSSTKENVTRDSDELREVPEHINIQLDQT